MRAGLHVLLPLCVLAMLASPAFAQGGVNLGWGDCALAGASTVSREFICNNDLGMDDFEVSFSVPDTVRALLRIDAEIELSIDAAALTPWFHYEPTGCRAGSLNVAAGAGGLPSSCADPWPGAAQANYDYAASFPENLDRGRLRLSVMLPAGVAIRVNPGIEYAAFRVTIDHRRSSGANRCPSCLDDGCLQMNGMTLTQAGGLPAIVMTGGTQTSIQWQTAVIPCPNPTPVRHPTWGAIKSLYR
jgi:hypothetical protein